MMTEAGIVGTLKRLCEWSGHGGTSGGRGSTTTFISPNTGGIGGRSPGRHSGSGGVGIGGGPGSWGGSGSMRHMHGSGSGHSTVGIDEDRFVVQRARVALDWLEHGEGTFVGLGCELSQLLDLILM